MVIAESTLSKTWITSSIKVTAVFLLSGLVSGLISGWLSSTRRLRGFLFLKGDKFLIPTYKFWTVFALVFSISLVVAYFLSRALGWLTLSPSVARQLLALFVVVASPVVLYFSTHANFLIAAIYYVVFLPLAMCIITARLRLLALAVLQNIFVLIAALIVVYVVLSLINGLSELYEYVQTGIAESLFAAAFGSWLTWTPRRFYERAA
jgi:hypothetical protein